MLLALDIGNSAIKFGIYDGDTLQTKFSIPTKRDLTANALKVAVDNRLDLRISSAILCSVVPELDLPLRAFVKNQLNVDPFIVKNDLDFGMKIVYKPLEAAGTDRIVNSFSAAEKYGVPCIVCSFGTATTIDVVNENRELMGGLIATGMFSSAKALHEYTSQLPEVEIKIPSEVIGTSTESSILSGIFYSGVGLVESSVSRIKRVIGSEARVIATGGFASMIASKTDVINIVDENLLLDGLNLLARRK